MTKTPYTVLVGSLMALALSGCSNQAEPEDPVVEEMVEELPEITPEEEALITQGDEATAPADSDTNGMESGSNEEGARQPDPKRSKLIKADPN